MVQGASTEDRPLAERVVKEAVERGLETPLREPILEAVDEADVEADSGRRWPVVGALVGLGVTIGYAAARAAELEEPIPTEAPESVEIESETESQPTATEEAESGRGLLRKGLLAAGVLGGAALVYRLLSSEDEPEWEPIEEFEPDTAAEEEFAGPTGTTTVDEEEVEGESDEPE